MNDLTRDLYTMKEICKKLEFRLEKEKERAAQAEAKNIALTKAAENLKKCLDQAEARAETLREEVERLRADKDEAYRERNNVVAALARLFPSGIRKTEIEGWNPEWHGCVYIDLPNGQISYHYHDSQAPLFAGLPAYTKEWDGHDKATVHLRLATFNVLRDERAVQAEARAESAWREGMLEAAGICEAKAMLNWAASARDCAAAIREKINS